VIDVECEHCLKLFDAEESMAGGLVNCPSCGRATEVPGLRDAWYRVVQAGMVAGWAVLTAIGWTAGGLTGALVVAVVAGALLLAVHAAM